MNHYKDPSETLLVYEAPGSIILNAVRTGQTAPVKGSFKLWVKRLKGGNVEEIARKHFGILSLAPLRAIDIAVEENLIHFSAPGYAPGEECTLSAGMKGILFADWNDKTHYDQETGQFVVTDDTMPRLGELAKEQGYELEWGDEWDTCQKCGLAVRTSPNSYSWQAAFWRAEEGDLTCESCVLKHYSSEYVQAMTNNPTHAITLDIDLKKHGLRQVNQAAFESGLHHGQNDDPRTVYTTLRKAGVNEVVFSVGSVGQFDIAFSVWVDQRSFKWAVKALANGPTTLPYDRAEEMSKVLRGEHSDYIHMETRTLTPEEFVSGNWVKK